MPEPLPLSKREAEIANLVVEGFRDLEIAEKLGIGDGTVAAHLHSMYRKAGVRNRTQLAIWWHDREEAVS